MSAYTCLIEKVRLTLGKSIEHFSKLENIILRYRLFQLLGHYICSPILTTAVDNSIGLIGGALRWRDNTPYRSDYAINSRTSVTFPVTAAAITITGDINNVRPDEEP
jgi:hypothetical protein